MNLALTHYSQRIREEERPLRFVVSRCLWRTKACDLLGLKVRLPAGPTIVFRAAAMAANLWVDNHHYDDAVRFLTGFLRSGDRFVDVGANIGVHTVIAATIVGPSGRIVAVEPHPRTFSYLEENVGLNAFDWAILHNVAAGAEPGDAYITSLQNDDENSLLAGEGGRQVRVQDLDSLLRSIDEINLLKIDVDGYETAVLLGASEVLERTLCVYFEAADGYTARYGYSLDDVFSTFAAKRFMVYEIDWERQRLDRLDRPFPGIRTDLVATRHPELVAARLHLDYQTVSQG